MTTAREAVSEWVGAGAPLDSRSGPPWRRSGELLLESVLMLSSSLRPETPFGGPAAHVDAAWRAHAYWRRLRRLTVGLLCCWLGVSLAVPWFATELNTYRLGRFPLGFWLSSQGALMIFVALIVVYVWVVERLDAAWQAARRAAEHDTPA
jgi:putative solute:sodium symporter small subunit